MTPVEACRLYMAVKLHFTSDDFDAFKNKRVRMSQETFEARNDRSIFERLTKKYPDQTDFIRLILSNFSYGNPDVIYGDPLLAEENMALWVSRKHSITQTVINDLNVIQDQLDKGVELSSIINFTSGDYPVIIPLVAGNRISIETSSILNDRLMFIPGWANYKAPMMVIEPLHRRMKKIHGFIRYTPEKVFPLIDSLFPKELRHI